MALALLPQHNLPSTELKDNMATTYEKIATTTLGSNASSITFSSISGTYTDFRVVLTRAGGTTTGFSYLQFNSDTATNYSSTRIEGDGSSATSARSTSGSQNARISSGINTATVGLITVDVFSYVGSTFKTYLATTSSDNNGSGDVQRHVGLWRSTAAITQISLLGNAGTDSWPTGTTATLYGILKA